MQGDTSEERAQEGDPRYGTHSTTFLRTSDAGNQTVASCVQLMYTPTGIYSIPEYNA